MGWGGEENGWKMKMVDDFLLGIPSTFGWDLCIDQEFLRAVYHQYTHRLVEFSLMPR